MFTQQDQEKMRQEAIDEPGSEPPCPFCKRPRVSRSSYIRCNACGINWVDEEMGLPDYLDLDPRVSRDRDRRARMGTETRPTAGTSAAVAE